MSKLGKMSISGIRSFGPEDRETITFHTPLTLILGPNGTGKTTIIECLKYITTGDFPPFVQKSGGFIHDPKILHESEVKAQVKLRIENVNKELIEVARNLMATQKPKKTEMKTVDSSIKKQISNGEWTTLSTRCVEMDKEMVNFLGVSKAILNNVVFCHQEDSAWPLGEAKSVKEKFDEIFAASRYIKALEEIRKIRSGKMQDIKLFKVELEKAMAYRLNQNKRTEQLTDMESRYKASKESISSNEDTIKPIKEKLILLGSKEGEVNKLKQKLGNQETSLQFLEKNKQSLLEQIKEVFVGDKAALKEEITNFSKLVLNKKRSLEEAKRRKKQYEQEANNTREKKDTASNKLGELKVLEKQHRERIANRENLIIQYAVDYTISGHENEENIREKDVEVFVMKLTCKFEQEVVDRDNFVKDYGLKEREFSEKIEDLQKQKACEEQTIKLSMERKRDNDSEIKSLTEKLKKVDNSARRQKDLELSLVKLENEKHQLESTIDTKLLKNEIDEKQEKKDQLEAKINQLNQEMTKLQLQSETRKELELLQKDKTSRDKQVNTLMFRHEEALTTLFGGKVPEDDVVEKLETIGNKLQQDLRVSNKELSELKSKLSATETSRQYQSQEIRKNENYIAKNREKIFDVVGNLDFEETLNSLQKSVLELQDEKGVLSGSQVVDRKNIERLERAQKPCCPLCERGFEDFSDAEELIKRLKRKNAMIPEQIEAIDVQITEKQKKVNLMHQLQPIQEELKRVTDAELPALKTKLTQFDKQIAEFKTRISSLENSVESMQNKAKNVSNIQPDMVLWHQSKTELEKLTQKVKVLKEKLEGQTGDGEVRSIQEVSDEREGMQIQLQSLSKSLKNNQNKISNYNDQIHNLNQKINAQRAEVLDIKNEQQKRDSFEEQKCKLVMDSKKIDLDVETSRNQIEELKTQINFNRGERDKVVKEKENKVKTYNILIEKLMKAKENLEQLTSSIQKYQKQGHSEKLETYKKTIDQLDSQLDRKEKEVQEKAKEIENIQKELANQELKERELQDNMKLKDSEVEIDRLKIVIREIRDKIGDIDTSNLFREKCDLEKEYHKINNEIQSLDGRIRELKKQIFEVKKELEEPEMKNAHKNYKKKLIELRTTELASDDLNKYYKALDTAVMQYHKVKMAEINKIIRELWRKTYRGNDIDYIEVATDQPDSSQGTDARRIYHYRVVMVNKDVHIDMRGRCSAGQKVLASLIIRLALAETFCFSCGILALDEPTTNLDRENIESLANSLSEIVQTRSKQRNFQLVIITHDTEFIEMLGRNNEVDFFYKISKDENCCSRIAKCRFQSIE